MRREPLKDIFIVDIANRFYFFLGDAFFEYDLEDYP